MNNRRTTLHNQFDSETMRVYDRWYSWDAEEVWTFLGGCLKTQWERDTGLKTQ